MVKISERVEPKDSLTLIMPIVTLVILTLMLLVLTVILIGLVGFTSWWCAVSLCATVISAAASIWYSHKA